MKMMASLSINIKMLAHMINYSSEAAGWKVMRVGDETMNQLCLHGFGIIINYHRNCHNNKIYIPPIETTCC